MDKLSMFNSLQKSIDILKSTECSQKEKIAHFGLISDAIVSYRTASMNNSFQNHLSAAIGTLLMFCEETDSSVRMSAEENLNKIVRFCEGNGSIVRVQIDLYHEIKKNGNEKALRICLALFGHYCGTIKQRKGKTYAQNLLPCIFAISKRRETQVLESLSAFIDVFTDKLESYMTDGEVLKITEIFVEDLSVDCATKRRCAARNISSFIARSRCPEFYANNTFNRCIEMLLKNQEQSAVLGVLTCFREILPIVLKHSTPEKSVEILDLVLHFLKDGNHSIVNAALEVIGTILDNMQPLTRKILLSQDLDHRSCLLKRKTLKNSVFKIHLSESLIGSRKSSTDARIDTLKPDKGMSFLQVTSTPTKFAPGDDKSLASASDLEIDFFRSMEFDNSLQMANCSPEKELKSKSSQADNVSLKSQKSSDSIGSFINTFLTTSTNAGESVSKFFRKPFDSPASGPTGSKEMAVNKRPDEDDLSLESLASSQISMQSSNADTIRNELDVMLEVEDSIGTETVTPADILQHRVIPDMENAHVETPTASLVGAMEDVDEPTGSSSRDLFIGYIHDQNILDYIARLIASKFLLNGTKHCLIPDFTVRVSVKSMSLQIISKCVQLRPEVLLLPLEKDDQKDEFDVVEILNLEDAINEIANETGLDQTEIASADGAAAAGLKSEGLLEMKEDHFGACDSSTYFEYFSPMSISLDQGLTSLKTKLKMVEENFSTMATDSQEKLSKELDAILSQSDCSGELVRKGDRRKELLVVPKMVTSKGDIVPRRLAIGRDDDQQMMADVLMFYNHSDPMLKGNVLLIVGHFLKEVLDKHGGLDEFFRKSDRLPVLGSFLNEDTLLQIIIQGLTDEIHTVVNQALIAFDLTLTPFCKTQPYAVSFQDDSTLRKFSFQKLACTNLVVMNSEPPPRTTIGHLLKQMTMVFHNKYWLVQCKVCDVIVNLDFDVLRTALGDETVTKYQDICLNHILLLLRDTDGRVRNHAGRSLLCFIENLSRIENSRKNEKEILEVFVEDFVLSNFAQPIDGRGLESLSTNQTFSNNAAKVMYILSNQLLNMADRNQLIGIINFLKVFICKYNPFDHLQIWNEFNLLNVLSSLMNEHTGTALDLTTQNDLMELCSILLVVTVSSKPITSADNESIDKFIFHILKILNIYQHLLLMPVIVPKSPKGELFSNPKELPLVNCFGYFGNDPFYVKLYNLLRNSLESYKITISTDVGQKLFGLLRTTIASLWRILEIKSISSMTNGFKFIEEVLRYLITFLPYEPEHCIRCTKYLLRFLFASNYINRLDEVNYFRKTSECLSPLDAVECRTMFDRYYEFCKCKTVTSVSDLGSYIKQFEQMVIACLKIYSKATSRVQAVILELLCQLLDFNINYQLLDSSNVFVESILKHIELVETGSIPESDRLMPKIVKFLFLLSHSKDRSKIINIPKIINICDNLLANALIRKTAIASLQALAREMFLLHRIAPADRASELILAEVGTQKEVILNMMIKFPEEIQCYKIAPMVLLAERHATKGKYEMEILSALVGAISEKKLIFDGNEETLIASRVLSVLDKETILDRSVFQNFLEIVAEMYERKDLSFNQKMNSLNVIIQYALLKSEENFLLELAEQFFKQESSLTSEEEFTKLILNILYASIEEFLAQNDGELVKNLVRLINLFGNFSNYPTIRNTVMDTINISKIGCVCADIQLQSAIIHFLLEYDIELEKLQPTMNGPCGTVINEQLNKVLIKMYLEHKSKTSNNHSIKVSPLIEQHFTTLLINFHAFLLENVSLIEYSDIIVSKTVAHLQLSRCNSKYLTLLEKSHLTSLHIIIEPLMELLTDKNVVISRKTALVLDAKLNALLKIVPLDDDNVQNFLPLPPFRRLLCSFVPERRKKHPKLFKTILLLIRFYEGLCAPPDLVPQIDSESLKQMTVDEPWFMDQIGFHCTSNSYTKPKNIARMLHEINSESKLINFLSQDSFNLRLLQDVIATSFENMFHTFRVDCVQFNPHLNYLKVHPMLKVALIVLMKKLNEFNVDSKSQSDKAHVLHCLKSNICFLQNIARLEHLCLMYVEARFIDRFVKDHILKSSFYETLLVFAGNCAKILRTKIEVSQFNGITNLEQYLRCIDLILRQKALWTELNQNDKYEEDQNLLIRMIFDIVIEHLRDTRFLTQYQSPEIFAELIENRYDQAEVYLQAILIARYVSERDSINAAEDMASCSKQRWLLMGTVESVAIAILKMDRFYAIAMTPWEVFNCYSLDVDIEPLKLPSVPIDYLYELDTLEEYLKRVNIFGYSSRQQFEELFMSLLVLINRDGDPSVIGFQEQYKIKHLCLRAIGNLLLTTYKFPRIGFRDGKFHHVPRNSPIKCETVGLKKLHNILLLIPSNSIFYQANFERNLMGSTKGDLGDNAIGTDQFKANQFSVCYAWQTMESTDNECLVARNLKYLIEKANLDVKSLVQLIYGLYEQMIEDNFSLVLPHLVQFCEICENRDQIRHLYNLVLGLQERVPMEDTLLQQHIIYLLCKMAALLVPTMAELSHLCTIIPTYLKSTQLYIRDATLNGLICLLECLVTSNTTMGGLSEELQLLRNIVVNYIVKHGIIDESSAIFSDIHIKLVWTLNFYVIENTSRFVVDCNLAPNSIISANNILKRTTNLEIYLCILNGLERLILTNAVGRQLQEKIEKLALDLVKLDNEMFSLSALKLLLTCIYHSSAEHLENTERSNGIVQDEPEIIIQQIEKIEILFAKIRTTTPQGAKIFGDVLCQLIRDLLPPSEILTKVFKELMLNQPNPDIIANVTYQVFRSAIDCSYLALLQEWLLCSLPNFLAFPQINKSVWCLTVIFLSASLNPNLLKIFPEVLSLPSYQQLNEREVNHFILSAKDFYRRLDPSQKIKFKEIFQQCDSFVYQSMMRCL